MKIRISTHPIDSDLLDTLKINTTSLVENRRVGSVLSRLAKKGYKQIHVSFDKDQYGQEDAPYYLLQCRWQLSQEEGGNSLNSFPATP